MSVSEWLLGTLCVLAFVIAIQVGLVWNILRSINSYLWWVKDMWASVTNIAGNIINIRDKIGARPSKWNARETNMDHLKSINSSKEMAEILNNAPWCPSANGNLCVNPNDGNWDTCTKCREKWLDAPYEGEF